MEDRTILFPTPLRPSPPPPPTSRRLLFRGSKSAPKSGQVRVVLAECMVGAILRCSVVWGLSNTCRDDNDRREVSLKKMMPVPEF